MDMELVVSALRSRSRRRVLKVLSKYFGYPSDALTVRELIWELDQDPTFTVRHRESVYKALELLVKSGLVEKHHEKGRGMCYRVRQTKLEIDFAEESIK